MQPAFATNRWKREFNVVEYFHKSNDVQIDVDEYH